MTIQSPRDLEKIKQFMFFIAYIDAALWTCTTDNGKPIGDTYTKDDIELEALAHMFTDCCDFIRENKIILDELDGVTYGQHGHDFWLTRNRHGTGFWDRDYASMLAKPLTESSEEWGECYLLPGDDNQLYYYNG
jgi:hypothetical protein